MNFTMKVIASLGMTGLSVIGASPGTGQNCPVYTSVECKLNNGEDCVTLSDRPYEECGNHDLNWSYEYCNESVSVMRMKSDKIEARTDQVKVTDVAFDTSNFGAGCRRPEVVKRTVNTCVRSAIASDIKIEGRLMDSDGVELEDQANYCFGYAFTRIQLRADEDEGEGTVGTYNPPNFDMELQCLFEAEQGSRTFDENCNDLPAPSSGGQCMRDVEFKYTITNKGGEARLLALIDEDNENLLGAGNNLSMGNYVNNPDPLTITKQKKIDLCKQAGQTITSVGTAIAASDPGARPAQRSASVSVTLP